MQTSWKTIKMAIWSFQLLPPPNLLHSLFGKRCPLSILKYPRMPEPSLKLFENLEIKIQEAQCGKHGKPINTSVLFSFAEQENAQYESFSTNELREIR